LDVAWEQFQTDLFPVNVHGSGLPPHSHRQAAPEIFKDPIWGDSPCMQPRREKEVPPDAREEEVHPGPGRGRRPSDHRDTEHLRCQYLSQVNALKLQEIFSKMFKCSFHLKQCDKCAEVHFLPQKCGSRLCPFESRRRAVERVATYIHLAQRSKNPRFLTLTQPIVPYEETDGLENGIKRLRKAIGRLIRRKIFRRVWGAIYSFEIVLRPGGFHIHAHMLMDALWLENRNSKGNPLEKAWRECLEGVGTVFGESSKGRAILWIEKCEPDRIREVLKYTVKGAGGGDGDSSGESLEPDPGSGAPPEAGSSVHTGPKIHIAHGQLRWDEVPFEGLKQLVDVVEGRVHLIEPILGWRGEVKRYLKEQAELGRRAAKELQWCHCGGKLIHLTSGPWGDPRLVFIDGKHELRDPSYGPGDILRKKAE